MKGQGGEFMQNGRDGNSAKRSSVLSSVEPRDLPELQAQRPLMHSIFAVVAVRHTHTSVTLSLHDMLEQVCIGLDLVFLREGFIFRTGETVLLALTVATKSLHTAVDSNDRFDVRPGSTSLSDRGWVCTASGWILFSDHP